MRRLRSVWSRSGLLTRTVVVLVVPVSFVTMACGSVPMSHRVRTVPPPEVSAERHAQDVAECAAAMPRQGGRGNANALYAACMIDRGHTATVGLGIWGGGIGTSVDVARSSPPDGTTFDDLISCVDASRTAVGADTGSKVARFIVPMAGMPIQWSVARDSFTRCMAPKGYTVR